jgi:decaprenyl-phosphate phosphoribosyltransferase
MFIILLLSISASFVIFKLKITITLFILFVAAILYNLRPIRLKDIPYIDVLSESINNPIRFMIGWFVFSNDFPSLWYLLLVWFLACILMTKKRLRELNKYSKFYRPSMRYYTKFSLKFMIFFYSFFSMILILIILLNIRVIL